MYVAVVPFTKLDVSIFGFLVPSFSNDAVTPAVSTFEIYFLKAKSKTCGVYVTVAVNTPVFTSGITSATGCSLVSLPCIVKYVIVF